MTSLDLPVTRARGGVRAGRGFGTGLTPRSQWDEQFKPRLGAMLSQQAQRQPMTGAAETGAGRFAALRTVSDAEPAAPMFSGVSDAGVSFPGRSRDMIGSGSGGTRMVRPTLPASFDAAQRDAKGIPTVSAGQYAENNRRMYSLESVPQTPVSDGWTTPEMSNPLSILSKYQTPGTMASFDTKSQTRIGRLDSRRAVNGTRGGLPY